jgi:acetyl esterase/lipase
MLTLADVHAFRDMYWGGSCGESRGGSWGGSAPYPEWTVPLDAARYGSLPPTLAIGAEHDPLRDDARVFAERIQAAGGQARLWIGAGLVHGCWRAIESSPGVQAMHDEVCRFLCANAGAA